MSIATAPVSPAEVGPAPGASAVPAVRMPTAVAPTVAQHRLRRIATAPLRGALSVVFVASVVAGTLFQGVGYLSNVGLRALDEPHSL
ncbi:hypothetical protein MT349_17090 [Rathayibacter caricis]|jgi:hypothetical protein|uniref:hypothetical protein n=1 Tax=Rathayibacter caricis TaxID=110936 RepID=UPI001FB2CD24|nr:hypothetical protein [Rathayibacter caricis]MCJ1697499.1 hypothetical protein [Rathayibacter caricis]